MSRRSTRSHAAVIDVDAEHDVASSMGDPYLISHQLGSEGKDKVCYEGRRGLRGSPVAVAQFKTQSSRVQQPLRRKGSKSSAAIRVEATFQRRAATAGLAPAIVEEDVERSRLVMELLPGGTLKDVAERQNGRLTLTQQARLVHLMRQLGAPTANGGAAVLHNDLGNPCNFLCDSEGTFFVIDFGLAKEIETATKAPLELPSDCAADANLLAIRHLLWDVQQGLITHRILTEPPSVLVSAYQDLVTRLVAGRSLGSSPPAVAAVAITTAALPAEPSVPPARGMLRRGSRRRTSPSPPAGCMPAAGGRVQAAAGGCMQAPGRRAQAAEECMGGRRDKRATSSASASPLPHEAVEMGDRPSGDENANGHRCHPGTRDAPQAGPQDASPSPSQPASASASPGRLYRVRHMRQEGRRCCWTAALALVWLLSVGSAAVAVALSPRGLNGTVPHWLAGARPE